MQNKCGAGGQATAARPLTETHTSQPGRVARRTQPAIPREAIEAVREAAPVEAVAAMFTDLRRRGAELTGICPFHAEKTPSFSINAESGRFFCFGCGAKGGDVFKLVMLAEGLGFPDAVRRVAEIIGTPLDGAPVEPTAEGRRLRAAYARRQTARQRERDFSRWEARTFSQALRERDEARERIDELGWFLGLGFHDPTLSRTAWYRREKEQAEDELAALIDREQILDERLHILSEGTDAERLRLFHDAA